MLKMTSENFNRALLLFLGLFLKISRGRPLKRKINVVMHQKSDEVLHLFDIPSIIS